jgi:hypothetical protein
VLAAIAFCPQPPLLVTPLAAGAAWELDDLRRACRVAIGRLAAAGPDRVVVLGAGPVTAAYPPAAAGTLEGFGYPIVASFGGEGRPPWTLPSALTLGAFLLTLAGLTGAEVPVSGQAVAADADEAAVAAALEVDRGRLGVLVMGDGTARRCERAPGYLDERAASFDAAVAAAMAAGDAATLRDLDPALGADLLAAGVPAWRTAGHVVGGRPVAAELLHESAPYGVAYLVATWLPA